VSSTVVEIEPRRSRWRAQVRARPASRCEYGGSSVEASGDYSADRRHVYCRHDRCVVLVAEADCLCGLRSRRRGHVAKKKNTEQGKEMGMGQGSDLPFGNGGTRRYAMTKRGTKGHQSTLPVY